MLSGRAFCSTSKTNMAHTATDTDENEDVGEQEEKSPVVNNQEQWVTFEEALEESVQINSLPEPPLLSSDLSSQDYLSKLESRLTRLKGNDSESSSKGLIKALEQARIDHTERLVKSSEGPQAFIIDEVSATQGCYPFQSVRQFVNPCQPVSSEEVQCLVDAEQ